MKAPSPLLGFNNNVKHKGRVFHIQTEDSGIKHPHVITHLFVDGGRILKSTKTSYAEFLEDEQMAVKVRQLMQEQHKAMFIALRAGKFDHLMEGESPAPASEKASDSAGRAKIPAPPSSQVGSTTGVGEAEAKSEKKPDATDGGPKSDAAAKSDPGAKSDVEAASAKPPAAAVAAARDKEPKDKEEPQPSSAQPASLRSAQIASQASIPRVRPPTAPPSRDGRGSSPPNPVSLRPPSLIPPPPRAPSPSMSSLQTPGHLTLGDRKTDPRAETEAAMPAADPRPRVNSPLELNLEALERSAAERAQGPVSGSDHRDLPPPPAAVLGKKPASIDTSYRSIAPPGAHASVAAAGPGRPPEPTGAGRTPPPPPASSPGAHAGSPTGGTFGAGPPMRPRTQPFGGIARPPTSERRSVTPQGARYAPSRPASIFGSARPQEGSSIFGEDLISEKSLDEVILSYLAEDLEGSKKG